MKNLYFLIIMLLSSTFVMAQAQPDTLIDCARSVNKKGKMVYLKSFQTKLNTTPKYDKWPIMLNSGVKYRFFLCQNAADKPENIELVLTDETHPENNPYGTTKKKGSFVFECNKAGTYYVIIRYKSGVEQLETSATAVVFYVKKNK